MRLLEEGFFILIFLTNQLYGEKNYGEIGISEAFLAIAKDSNYTFLKDTPAISLNCRNALKNIVQSIGQPWTMQMFDATAKLQSGILSGNLNNYGDRKACIGIYSDDKKKENGRYYRVKLGKEGETNGDQGAQFTHGFCIPQRCTPNDLAIGLTLIGGLDIEILVDDYQELSLDFDGFEIAFCILISIIVLFIVIGTGIDLLSHLNMLDTKRELFVFLRLFSILASTKELFSMPQKSVSSTKRLNSLDGIRFLSISWVLICHSFSASFSIIEDSLTSVQKVMGTFWGQTVFNAFNSVDSFFLLSGLLVSYLTIKELERNNGRINWFLYYFHRFVRITMVYSIIIFMFASVLRHVSPSNNEVLDNVRACRDHAWENLLYIENFVSQDFRCIGQGWYLNCDMQMFVITPLILFPLYRWRKVGFAIGSLIILGSTSILAAFHYKYRDEWGATLFGSLDEFFDLNYTQPWMRIQPYIIGIFLGYILYKTKGVYKLPKYVVIIGWISAVAVGFACIYGLRLDEYFGKDYKSVPLAARIAYGSLHRLGWALALGWVIFACENGYGGVVNEFLSWNFFKPWSKITFLIFLTHMVITLVIFDNINFVIRFSALQLLIVILGILNLSALVSTILYVTLEVPFSKLEKYVVSKFIKQKKIL